ncbi:MAG: hypothetical protein COB36_09850 [Alphaproteobacteria bacterium]|nr:MAG: hypothetical protein COB36_09850 [Alphaproteobacteria bacterium]
MKKKSLLIFLFTFINSAVIADIAEQPTSSEYLVVQVNGIVCSFCAYGTEKNLRKLDFLDSTQFGNDGVLVDINAHTITLALQRQKPVQYAQINAAILNGGYDPIAYYALIQGVIRESADGYQLVNEDNGQIYILPNTLDLTSQSGHEVAIRTVLDPSQAGSVTGEQVIRLSTIELQL